MAGTQQVAESTTIVAWVPAYAGMTSHFTIPQSLARNCHPPTSSTRHGRPRTSEEPDTGSQGPS